MLLAIGIPCDQPCVNVSCLNEVSSNLTSNWQLSLACIAIERLLQQTEVASAVIIALCACRAAFDDLIKRMHVSELQTKPPARPAQATSTGHAFLAANSDVLTVAEAVLLTEQLKQTQQAANQQVHVLSVADSTLDSVRRSCVADVYGNVVCCWLNFC